MPDHEPPTDCGGRRTPSAPAEWGVPWPAVDAARRHAADERQALVLVTEAMHDESLPAVWRLPAAIAWLNYHRRADADDFPFPATGDDDAPAADGPLFPPDAAGAS